MHFYKPDRANRALYYNTKSTRGTQLSPDFPSTLETLLASDTWKTFASWAPELLSSYATGRAITVMRLSPQYRTVSFIPTAEDPASWLRHRARLHSGFHEVFKSKLFPILWV